ncbi:ER membrane protein complex subunit 8 [Hypsizygus marmoreus]|uniref:ER membrane protein complex subunit 8 n=1 Tax=Hypsizygus marmoreus TaxID=39966 RepID=A0A369JNA8_HYPMA|nr:ER membrane protein complex subunit 8 [Hypsizygus marmoreus]
MRQIFYDATFDFLRVSTMSSYTISGPAYYKVFFHAAKHPHKAVNGVFVGKLVNGAVLVEDAIPLLHHWTSLSPMMEIGLDLAGQYADSLGLTLVGYYQASDRLDDTSLVPVGEKIAGKLKAGFADAVAFVIDGEKLGTGEAALIPYVSSSSSSWRPYSGDVAPFAEKSKFKLAFNDLPQRAIALVRDEHLHRKFGDFDDHLEDVSIDWLRNKASLPAES